MAIHLPARWKSTGVAHAKSSLLIPETDRPSYRQGKTQDKAMRDGEKKAEGRRPTTIDDKASIAQWVSLQRQQQQSENENNISKCKSPKGKK